MLNLLKYGPGGEQSYRAYSAALKDYLPTIGAEVLASGTAQRSWSPRPVGIGTPYWSSATPAARRSARWSATRPIKR